MHRPFSLSSLFGLSEVSFEGKKEQEQVLLIVRRHWFTLLATFVMLVIGFVLPFVVIVFLGSVLIKYSLLPLIVFATFSYYMLVWFMFGLQLTLYALDMWVITDLRVMDIDQPTLFGRTVSEVELENIEDITVKVNGVIPTFLDFGKLELQSAGAIVHFEFENAPHPQSVKETIAQAAQSQKTRKFHSDASEIIKDVELAREGLLNPDENTHI